MSGRERCDEILRLIDQVLAEQDKVGGRREEPLPEATALSRVA